MRCEYSQYLEVLYCGYCLYSKYFVFRYCGYILACALGVRHCSYSHYSQYLGLLSTRSILAASTPILSVLGLRFVVEHLSVKPSCYPEHQERKRSFWGAYIVCAVPYSVGHKVLWRNLDLAQLFCTYVHAAYIEEDRRESSVQNQYPLTGTLFYISIVCSNVEMIPHLLFPQTIYIWPRK